MRKTHILIALAFLITVTHFSAFAATPYDFDGDNKADLAVFRPSNNTWYMLLSTDVYRETRFGENGDIPVASDYDGDNKTDIAIYRPSNRNWFVLRSSTNQMVNHEYGPGIPVPGDFNGDRQADYSVFAQGCSGLWTTIVFPGDHICGPTVTDDRPVVGDFNGDGRFDRGRYNPSTGEWSLYNSFDPTAAPVFHAVWGVPGDVPAVADFDGDNKTDLAVWRPADGYWYVLRATGGIAKSPGPWGIPGDKPVPADFDGDGKADFAIYRPSNGTWYFYYSDGVTLGSRQFGTPEDIPVQNVIAQ